MTRDDIVRWVTGYERAWRSPGTALLGGLFASNVTYVPSPWATPIRGLEGLARFWESERAGPDEAFDMESSVFAVEGNNAVVRVGVAYGGPTPEDWRDLWVLTFDKDLRCLVFEEWPFAPDQDDGHRG